MIKEVLGWAVTMVNKAHKNPNAARKDRAKWVELILEGIRSYRKKGATQKESHYLSDMIQDTDTWELVGFATNLQYIRADHSNDEMLKYMFVHPWGTPPLLYKHKRLPMFITVGPGIRWDNSVLKEIDDNGYNDSIEGATG